MEIIGIVISLIALSLTLFTYFKHDLKIKQQAALLNKYQLEKNDNEKEEQKRAIIETKVIKADKGTRILKVYNRGKSTAKQVNVIIPDVKGLRIFNNPCPIDIRPQNRIDISLAVTLEGPDKINIEFEWKDNFKVNNTDSQTIQL
jgi:hypothetical protein